MQRRTSSRLQSKQTSTGGKPIAQPSRAKKAAAPKKSQTPIPDPPKIVSKRRSVKSRNFAPPDKLPKRDESPLRPSPDVTRRRAVSPPPPKRPSSPLDDMPVVGLPVIPEEAPRPPVSPRFQQRSPSPVPDQMAIVEEDKEEPGYFTPAPSPTRQQPICPPTPTKPAPPSRVTFSEAPPRFLRYSPPSSPIVEDDLCPVVVQEVPAELVRKQRLAIYQNALNMAGKQKPAESEEEEDDDCQIVHVNRAEGSRFAILERLRLLRQERIDLTAN